MNLFDVVVLVLAAAAGLGGWRFGFVTRVLAWCGVLLGLLLGVQFVPRVVTSFGGTNADDRVTVAILFLLLIITLGQTAGFGVSLLVHRPARMHVLPRWDRALGAALGVSGTLLLVWLVVPSMRAAPGWPARLARGSAVVRIADHAPAPPNRFEAIGRTIRDAPYPTVTGATRAADPGEVQHAPVPKGVSASVVRVESAACGYDVFGTGWTYAPEFVMTAAHVVARQSRTTVDWEGRSLQAVVVVFDSRRDVAVLHVPALRAPRLHVGTARAREPTAVFGYPGGGGLHVTDARVGSARSFVVSDVLGGRPQPRRVLPLHADVRGGDSGGPVVSGNGHVVGLVFAAARHHLAFATAIDDLRPAMERARDANSAVGTGHCR